MPRSKPLDLTEYEENDPLWWLQHHKNTLSYLCVRVKQLIEAMKEDNIDEIETYTNLIQVVLTNLEKEAIKAIRDVGVAWGQNQQPTNVNWVNMD